MRKVFTFIFAVAISLCISSANAQTEQREISIKPEARPEFHKTDLGRQTLQLRNSEVETRADYKPFPDSTITYNLKGEPIGKTIYEYNEKGDEISYKAYKKDEKTGSWFESSKNITTYDDAGNRLSGESSTWDESKNGWIGNYKYACVYNASGQQIVYEEYVWDAQANNWRGSSKYTYDYETGNERVTTYNWDTDTKGWVPSERNEYVSETVRYREYWWSSDEQWGTQVKIEQKMVVEYDKLGVNISIYEEHRVSKNSNGSWNEEDAYVTIGYDFSALASWWASGYETYDISYDNSGNITSVALSAASGNVFTTDFAYDYNVNKVNVTNVYRNGELADGNSCVYDERGRRIERTWNYNNNGEIDNSKYGYTYVGDSQTYNSIEYYLWDSSKKVFVKESKNMYIRNEDDKNTMYQTYSWAETKWVLSSYTIYYPNDYTSDLEMEETESVGSENKGSFEVGFNLPQDAEVTGSFYITFPKGFVLDEENTVLSDALSGKYTILITPQEKENTWFVEIKEVSTYSLSTYNASSYKKILTIAYKVDEETKKGDYKAEIKNLNFVLSDGTMLIEQERDVTITVARYGVSNEPFAADEVKVFAAANALTVDTPNAETIHIYRINGELVYSAQKTAGKYSITMNGWTNGVYIVTGSKDWTAKVIVK